MKEIQDWDVFEYIPFWKYCFMQRYVKNFIRSFLYGHLSARCDHFCPTSERVKLLTSHRAWSKNDRIYLDLSTTRNMIAFPEFSNRLPWNLIEHITVFNSKSGKIRKRKTKREREWEIRKIEKNRSFGWKLF